jgi:hypothetical protein
MNGATSRNVIGRGRNPVDRSGSASSLSAAGEWQQEFGGQAFGGTQFREAFQEFLEPRLFSPG